MSLSAIDTCSPISIIAHMFVAVMVCAAAFFDSYNQQTTRTDWFTDWHKARKRKNAKLTTQQHRKKRNSVE